MGWSDAEFWQSTPRRYYTVVYTFAEFLKPPEAKPKKGSEAIREILGTMSRMQK